MARAQQTVLIALVGALVGADVGVRDGCELVGIARATYYRITRNYSHYRPVVDPTPHKDRHQPAALTASERTAIVSVLEADDYADLSVVQTYWRAFDSEEIDCSERTFYRIAAQQGLVGDRRRSKLGGLVQHRSKPIVHAGDVGELWSWDVTELRGPRTQDRYRLYLVIDVFSRYPVGWRVEYSEDSALAVAMFARAIERFGAPNGVHADNGAVMRSDALVSSLVAENVVPTYSRPRVSDDNPFSESLFKTIKYDLNCPPHFDDIEHARTWTTEFLHRYATEHRHSGLGRHTPHQVHTGIAADTQQRRQRALDRAYANHPNRYRAAPCAPDLPGPTGINTNLSRAG